MVRLRVREVAEQKGVRDATDLARRTDVAYATAYRLWKGDIGGTERGERSIGIMTLHRVARALGVSLGELYIEEDRLALVAALA